MTNEEWAARFNEIMEAIESSLGRGFTLTCLSSADDHGVCYRYQGNWNDAETEYDCITFEELDKMKRV